MAKNSVNSEIAVCPICGQKYTGLSAVSRADGRTLICPDCGIREALTAAGFKTADIEWMVNAMREMAEEEE